MADLTNQPLSSFEGAAARTDQQRAALLQAVAQAGTAGVQQYQQAQSQTNDLKGQAINSALGAAQGSPLAITPGGTNPLTAPIEQNFAMRQADLAQGQATFGQDIARQQAGNESFFGQMQQALPVVENHTKVAIQQILAQQEEAQKQRDLQYQLGQMQLQEAQTRASQTAAGPQDNRTPEDKRIDAANASLAENKVSASQTEAQDAQRQKVVDKAVYQLGGAKGAEGAGYQAFLALLNGLPLQQAQQQFKTPKGNSLNWGLIQQLVDEHNRVGASNTGLLNIGT